MIVPVEDVNLYPTATKNTFGIDSPKYFDMLWEMPIKRSKDGYHVWNGKKWFRIHLKSL